MEKKIEIDKNSVFLFGSSSNNFVEPLKSLGIKIERVLDGCHPFAIVGENEPGMEKYVHNTTPVPIVTQIKKNFEKLLARDMEDYESNISSENQPLGVHVYRRNRAEYLVVYFSDVMRTLYKVNQAIYSAWGTPDKVPFRRELESREKILYPFPPMFNWKYYLELFAHACLGTYDSDHIILVRTSISDWYVEGTNIRSLVASQQDTRACIKDVEDYFVEYTNCHEVKDLYCYPRDKKNEVPNFSVVYQPPVCACEQVAKSICEILRSNKTHKKPRFRHKLLCLMQEKLTDEKLEVFYADMEAYDKCNDVEIEKYFLKEPKNEYFAALSKLAAFLNSDGYTLTEYLKSGTVEIGVFELYVEYFKLDSSDMIAICMLYDKIKDKKILKKVISGVVQHKNCYPTKAMDDFINHNKEYLLSYEYLNESLKESLLKNDQNICYARLTDSCVVRFSLNAEPMISYVTWTDGNPAAENIIENGMVCKINEIDNLSMNWRFYIRKAKTGNADTPLKVVVKGDEFERSLLFLNYKQILESENALIMPVGDAGNVKCEGYKAKCNLSILMDKRVKIFFVAWGLSNQMDFYLFSKYVQKMGSMVLIYDDLTARKDDFFSGIQFDMLANEDKNDLRLRMLSNIISSKLYKSYPSRKPLPDFLYENGWKNIITVTMNSMKQYGPFPKISSCLVMDNANEFREMDVNNEKLKYWFFYRSSEIFYYAKDNITEWIKFPDFDSEENIAIANEMLSCDAVVIHMRCGDYMSTSDVWIDIHDYYFTCINNLLKIKEYKNKKYFIFSDDMNWVKKHHDELGLGLIDEKDIRYVTNNERERSFWDMKLISLGKIIIIGNGTFARKGVMLSTRKEIAESLVPSARNGWKAKGWKNKYEIFNANMN